MYYAQMRALDIANGPGVRSTLFVSGCRHKCPGCFNELYQDFSYGNNWDEAAYTTLLSYLCHPKVSGLTLLGGEPMQQVPELTAILKRLRADLKERHLERSIWVYSGYTLEQILSDPDRAACLAQCDVLVDGLFREDLLDLRLRFRGSSNQRILNARACIKEQRPIYISYEKGGEPPQGVEVSDESPLLSADLLFPVAAAALNEKVSVRNYVR